MYQLTRFDVTGRPRLDLRAESLERWLWGAPSEWHRWTILTSDIRIGLLDSCRGLALRSFPTPSQ